jgi:hypothetical protein
MLSSYIYIYIYIQAGFKKPTNNTNNNICFCYSKYETHKFFQVKHREKNDDDKRNFKNMKKIFPKK